MRGVGDLDPGRHEQRDRSRAAREVGGGDEHGRRAAAPEVASGVSPGASIPAILARACGLRTKAMWTRPSGAMSST